MKTTWEVPIKTVSEANISEHWINRSRRHRYQQRFVRLSYAKEMGKLNLPCEVTLTRLASRMLDDDNLCYSFKYIRDELSECIFPEKRKFYVTKKGKIKHIKGRADSDPRIKWHYAQEKSSRQGIRIEIVSDL